MPVMAAGLVSGLQAATRSDSGAAPRPGRQASPANSILAANYGEEGEADTAAADGQSSLQGRGSLSTAASGVSLTSQGSAALPPDFFQQVGFGICEVDLDWPALGHARLLLARWLWCHRTAGLLADFFQQTVVRVLLAQSALASLGSFSINGSKHSVAFALQGSTALPDTFSTDGGLALWCQWMATCSLQFEATGTWADGRGTPISLLSPAQSCMICQ